MAPSVMNTVVTARDDPEALVQFLSTLANAPDQFLALYSPSLPPPDQAALAIADVKGGLLLDCEASLRQSGQGMARDFHLAAQDWGFSLEEIKSEVLLWHGMEDINAPLAMSEHLVNVLPNSTAHFVGGVGHLCLSSLWPLIIKKEFN